MTQWNLLPESNSEDFQTLVHFCDSHDRELKATLPVYAHKILRDCGGESLISFVSKYGGVPIYISKNKDNFQKKYGLNVSDGLYATFLAGADSGGSLSIPSACGLYLAIRRAAIRMALPDCRDDRQIAETFGASLRYIKQERRLMNG